MPTTKAAVALQPKRPLGSKVVDNKDSMFVTVMVWAFMLLSFVFAGMAYWRFG